MEELIKQSDGSVNKVVTTEVQQVVETKTADQMAELNQELSDVELAIKDIDNFKQRRLDNLNQRQAELLQYQKLLAA